MRDKLKNIEYFENYFSMNEKLIELSYSRLEKGTIPEGKIVWTKMRLFKYSLEKAIAEYSLGISFGKIRLSLLQAIKRNGFFEEGWIGKTTRVYERKTNAHLNQYNIEPYSIMLRMLSMGVLLNIDEEDFMVLVDKIDQANITDSLFEFIIRARLPKRVKKQEKPLDKKNIVILKAYDKLRKSIKATDDFEAIDLIKQYLQKDFYHKDSGFYESHKMEAYIYYGYWSFEAVAIASILEVDDSSFRDNEYYPSDIADYYNSIVKELTG